MSLYGVKHVIRSSASKLARTGQYRLRRPSLSEKALAALVLTACAIVMALWLALIAYSLVSLYSWLFT